MTKYIEKAKCFIKNLSTKVQSKKSRKLIEYVVAIIWFTTWMTVASIILPPIFAALVIMIGIFILVIDLKMIDSIYEKK